MSARLAELLRPESLDAVALNDVPDIIGALEAAKARLQLRLFGGREPVSASPVGSRCLDVKEAARLLGMSVDWLYRHGKELPFSRKIGRSVRFDEAALREWQKRRAV